MSHANAALAPVQSLRIARLAEIHDDETAATAIGVLRRAVSWFEARGVTVERVLSDNGSAYKSHAWRDTCNELGIKPKKTRPYRPQTNGKIERFHRTLADGLAFSRHYNTESARRAALPESCGSKTRPEFIRSQWHA